MARIGLGLAVVLALVAGCGGPRQVVDTYPGTQQPSRSGSTVDGRQEGAWTYWYATGTRRAEGAFTRDMQHGAWRYWNEDGSVAAQGAYANGMRIGAWTYFHPNGRVRAQGGYGPRGTQHGWWRFFHDDGSLSEDGLFIDGARALVWGNYGKARQRWVMRDGTRIELADLTSSSKAVDTDGWRRLRAGATELLIEADGTLRLATTSAQGGAWQAWREDGALLGWGLGDTAHWFDVEGRELAGDVAVLEPGLPATGDLAALVAGLRTTLAAHPAPESRDAPAPTPAPTTAGVAPFVGLPGFWTPREERLVNGLIKRYRTGEDTLPGQYSSTDIVHPRAALNGKPLPRTRLVGADGGVIDLDQSKGREKVVLVVLRGFSGQVCIYCAAQTAAIADALPRFTAAKARVVMLYPGAADSVPQFQAAVRSLGQPLPSELTLAIDPDLVVVRALGLEDALAKPSVLILDQQGIVRWNHVGVDKADRPSADRLLDEVQRIATPKP